MPMHAYDRCPAQANSKAPAKVHHSLASPTLQAKLAVGAPDDEYEREADRVAEQVTRGAAPPVSPAPPRVQRACACGGTCSSCREEELQRSPSSADQGICVRSGRHRLFRDGSAGRP